MTIYTISVYGCKYGTGVPVNAHTLVHHQKGEFTDSCAALIRGDGFSLDIGFNIRMKLSMTPADHETDLKYGNYFTSELNLCVTTPHSTLDVIDVSTLVPYVNSLLPVDLETDLPYVNSLPPVDVQSELPWHLVNIYGEQRDSEITVIGGGVLNFDFGYDSGNTPNNFDFNAPEPQRLTDSEQVTVFYPGRAQPSDTGSKISVYKKSNPIDYNRIVRWGYNIDNFIVGGITVPSTPAPDAIEPDDVIEHINYEVFIAVNSVTITERVSGTAINFDNFSISRDIESFAWTTSFDVLDKESFNVIRPQGKTVKTVDIDINGTVFTCVVTKSQLTQKLAGNAYRCTGWTPIKMLSDPYSPKKSFTDSQTRTAAQIINQELVGTGYSYTWSTVDWSVPAGVHSYQDKTILGAMLEVINAIGAVIVPDTTLDSFEVKPYYPVNPWAWGTETPDRTIDERQFFETTQETVINSNPNGVFIYGEEIGGVGVKAVRNGTAGDKTLPDVVNKYMTEQSAAQERGRVELCKNGFIEQVSMVTYVDTASGIIMPQDLIEFTDMDSNTWRGMVLSTSVNCNRVGTALRQSIVVARYYDD